MQFHIRYRNTQGTLMRILNAASRRGARSAFRSCRGRPSTIIK